MGSNLPSKEANLFKLIVKSYETKQYKKGLKAADQILKKFPEHGETLAMKGLTLNCMDRKTEAYDLVRKGLKNDLKSHVCWHVYGLLHRSDREYREAIKCYLNALRIDPDNIQILRDLSLLQAQMRDLGGFVETRRTLLQLKPSHRINWIGFAVAQHLNSSPERAVDILEAFEKTLDENYPPDEERYEHSEMLLYKASLLEESGALETALNELEKKSNKIVDKLGLEEFRASLLWKLGRLAEAEVIYRYLLAINPDNHNYYEGLQKCLNLPWGREKTCSAEEIEALLKLYEKLQEEFPSSLAAKRIPLDFLEGSAFRKAVDNYVRPFLRKGVPSLFSDLRPLYDQPGKADCLEEILIQIESSLRISGTFPGSSEEEPPSALMWTLFLLAQHYDCRKQYSKALEKIDEAIAHTPTVIDLYLVKGRIHKHGGDMIAAAALADEARSMDLADRFINSESVKRMLQADQVDLAEKTAMLFTKDGNQHSNLYDMQCMWYELASGDSYFRQDSIGKALKKYLSVEKHYADMVEDQFDFHTYCLRKMTLRAYVRLLRFQDRLHSHRFFHQAAAAAIRCYLRLYDAPLKTAVEEVTSVEGLPATERKRLRQKQRKAEARAKKEAEEKAKEEEAGSASSATKSGRKGAQPSRPVDTDPDGEKLLQVEDPLGEATKYLKLLQDHSSNILETHIFAFELYFRKKKVLLAFQAIKKQLQIDAEDPDVHRCVVKFFHMLERLPSPSTESEKLVRNVIELERESLKVGEGKSLLEMNHNFLEKHKDSLRHRAAAAEILLLLSPQRSSEALEIIESSVNNAGKSNGSRADCVGQWILKDCISVHKLIQNTFNNAEAATRWQHRCSELYPYSTYFRGAKSSVVLGTQSRTTCTTEPNGDTNMGGIGMHTGNGVQISDFQKLRV